MKTTKETQGVSKRRRSVRIPLSTVPIGRCVEGRCNTKQWIELFDALKAKISPRRSQIIEGTIFKDLIHIPDISQHHSVVDQLLANYDEARKGFMVGPKLLRFRVEDVAIILGLSTRGDTFKIGGRRHGDLYDRYNESKNLDQSRDTLAELLKGWPSKDSDVDFVKFLLVYFLGTVLFPQANSTIPMWLFSMIDDLDSINNKGWARAIHRWLMESVEKAIPKIGARNQSNGKGNIFINGCTILLQIWLYELTGVVEQGAHNYTPRIMNWGSSSKPRRGTIFEMIEKLDSDDIKDEIVPHEYERHLLDIGPRMGVCVPTRKETRQGVEKMKGKKLRQESSNVLDIEKMLRDQRRELLRKHKEQLEGERTKWEEQLRAMAHQKSIGDESGVEITLGLNVEETQGSLGDDKALQLSPQAMQQTSPLPPEQHTPFEILPTSLESRPKSPQKGVKRKESEQVSEAGEGEEKMPSRIERIKRREERKPTMKMHEYTQSQRVTRLQAAHMEKKKPKKGRRGLQAKLALHVPPASRRKRDARRSQKGKGLLDVGGEQREETEIVDDYKTPEGKMKPFWAKKKHPGMEELGARQRKLIEKFLGELISDKPLWIHPEVTVNRAKLYDLIAGNDLSDDIIDAAIIHRREEVARTPQEHNPSFFFNTHFQNVLRSNPQSKLVNDALDHFVQTFQEGLQLIFIPVYSDSEMRTEEHKGKQLSGHWHLLVIDLERKQFRSFNSVNIAKYRGDVEHTVQFMKEWSKREKQFTVIQHFGTVYEKCPQQSNGRDCGMYLILFMQVLSRKQQFNIEQKFMPNNRLCLAVQLLRESGYNEEDSPDGEGTTKELEHVGADKSVADKAEDSIHNLKQEAVMTSDRQPPAV